VYLHFVAFMKPHYHTLLDAFQVLQNNVILPSDDSPSEVTLCRIFNIIQGVAPWWKNSSQKMLWRNDGQWTDFPCRELRLCEVLAVKDFRHTAEKSCREFYGMKKRR